MKLPLNTCGSSNATSVDIFMHCSTELPHVIEPLMTDSSCFCCSNSFRVRITKLSNFDTLIDTSVSDMQVIDTLQSQIVQCSDIVGEYFKLQRNGGGMARSRCFVNDMHEN